MRATVVQNGQRLEVDVIDVVEADDEGRLTRLRAYFDLEGARPI
jgi:hypothetical protein